MALRSNSDPTFDTSQLSDLLLFKMMTYDSGFSSVMTVVSLITMFYGGWSIISNSKLVTLVALHSHSESTFDTSADGCGLHQQKLLMCATVHVRITYHMIHINFTWSIISDSKLVT